MTSSAPLLCAAGDVHGHVDQLYAELLAFEAGIGGRFAHVLQVGDLGIWPDPGCIDAATRRHEGPGDVHAWCAERRPVPRPTTFIHGIHEDFRFLGALDGPEVLPGLHSLRGGESVVLPGGVRVAGIGGSYGASHDRRGRRAGQPGPGAVPGVGARDARGGRGSRQGDGAPTSGPARRP